MEVRNITIFGTGALASVFASLLNKTSTDGPRITMFGAWKEQIRTARNQGLTLVFPNGAESHAKLNATDDPSDLPFSDLALILVKSHQTQRAAEQAAKILNTNGVVVTLQNGLGNFEKIARAVGKKRTVVGMTYLGAYMIEAGKVRCAAQGKTHLGLRRHLEPHLHKIADLFNAAGIETELTHNIESLIWSKLLVNAVINPLTALLEVKNGDLLADPRIRQIFVAGVEEVAEVARAQAIPLLHDDVVEYALTVCKMTGENRSSMLQDILRGAPTEIDAICGAIVEIGRNSGVSTPVNEFLLKQIKLKEAGQLTAGSKQ